MLYLIKEFGKENKKYLKIGKADNINKRMQQYNTDCAEFELIDTFEGSIPEENLLHSILNKYKVKGEWMEYNEEILLLWKLYKEVRPKIHESILQHEGYITREWLNSEINYYKNQIEQYKELVKTQKEFIIKLKDICYSLLSEEQKSKLNQYLTNLTFFKFVYK